MIRKKVQKQLARTCSKDARQRVYELNVVKTGEGPGRYLYLPNSFKGRISKEPHRLPRGWRWLKPSETVLAGDVVCDPQLQPVIVHDSACRWIHHRTHYPVRRQVDEGFKPLPKADAVRKPSGLKAPHANRMVTLDINREHYEQVRKILEQRGSSFSEWVNVHLRAFDMRKARYDEADVMPIGKYKGQKIALIIRTDPRYVIWATQEWENFSLNTELQLQLNRVWSVQEDSYSPTDFDD